MPGPVGAGRFVEKTPDAGVGFGRHRQAGECPGAERDEHPAAHREIGIGPRLVAPPTPTGLLARDDEPDRALRRRPEKRIARHPDRLAQRHRRDPVTIEPGAAVRHRIGGNEQIAIGLLHRHEPLQPAADDVTVAAVEMIVASAEEGQEGQASGGGV